MTHVTKGTRTTRRTPPKKIFRPKIFFQQKMNFNETKLHSATVLFKLELDTKDQVLYNLNLSSEKFIIKIQGFSGVHLNEGTVPPGYILKG